jgi:TRAP-type mannitol/chloroaromatic compound transport system permease small subunit
MLPVKKLASYIDTLNEWVGKIIPYAVVPMILFMLFEVICRYLLNAPTTWVWQVNTLIYNGMLIICGGYVYLHDEHVRMDFPYERLNRKWQAILELAASPLFFVFIIVVMWQGLKMAASSLSRGEHLVGVDFQAPVYINKTIFFIAAALVFLQGISKFIRNYLILKEKNFVKEEKRDVFGT